MVTFWGERVANYRKKSWWQQRDWVKKERLLVAENEEHGSPERPAPHTHDVKLVKAAHALKQQNPYRYRKDIAEMVQNQSSRSRQDVLILIDNGLLDTGHMVSFSGQNMANDMWQFIAPHRNQNAEKPPLLVNSPKSIMSYSTTAHVQDLMPEYIFLNENFIHCSPKPKPEVLRAVIAHEMAHIINGDIDLKSISKAKEVLPNEARELIADRMAAIIYGNPRKYSEAIHKLQMGKREWLKSPEKLTANRKNFVEMTTTHELGYSPPLRDLRSLSRWADILEEHGATDKDGNITKEMLPKALALFDRGAEITRYLGEIDSADSFRRALDREATKKKQLKAK